MELQLLDKEQDSPQEAYELMSFKEVWSEQPLSYLAPTEGESKNIESVLCFLSNTENQQILIQILKKVSPQTAVFFIEEGKDDFEKTLQNHPVGKNNIDAILYLWPLENSRWIKDFSPIVTLLQTLGKNKISCGKPLAGSRI